MEGAKQVHHHLQHSLNIRQHGCEVLAGQSQLDVQAPTSLPRNQLRSTLLAAVTKISEQSRRGTRPTRPERPRTIFLQLTQQPEKTNSGVDAWISLPWDIHTLRSFANRSATAATTCGSLSHFLSASVDLLRRWGRGAIEMASAHRGPLVGHS